MQDPNARMTGSISEFELSVHRRDASDCWVSRLSRRLKDHSGSPISQRKRKRIEEIFRWLKTVAGLRKIRHRGVARVGWMFTLALAAYNELGQIPISKRNCSVSFR